MKVEADGSMATALVSIVTFVIFNASTYYVFIENICHLVVFFARWYWYILDNSMADWTEKITMMSAYTVLQIGICLLCFDLAFSLEKSERMGFILIRKLYKRMSRNKDIMSILLPDFVKKNFIEQETYIIKEAETVTVLFAYILNFDEICMMHEETELIELLDKIFLLFDKSCEQFGVAKIETVGNCYMACAGLKDSEKDIDPYLERYNHGERCAFMAVNMIQKIKKQVLKNDLKLEIKIGLNSGDVIAGVVGKEKP